MHERLNCLNARAKLLRQENMYKQNSPRSGEQSDQRLYQKLFIENRMD